ncbi:MAG: methyltransferase domain-containing protein [Pseudomonadota bacterium]
MYRIVSLASVLIVSACAFDTGGGRIDSLAGTRLAPPPIDYVALVGHPDRPADDFAEDAARKPAEVLEFTGVGYGMTVIDMEAGGGYYTELFSRAVGDTGKVYLQNPKAFDAVLGDAVPMRLAEDRLSNVETMTTPMDTLLVEDASVDIVAWFLGPHELWFTPDGAEQGVLGSPDKAFAEIVRALKPGGVFVALDHAAAAGSPASTGGTTHRIDPAIIIARSEDAGLTLVDSSDILANADDDYSVMVLDPSVRRKTDRFLLKFEKK